jgi:hypothetical protein
MKALAPQSSGIYPGIHEITDVSPEATAPGSTKSAGVFRESVTVTGTPPLPGHEPRQHPESDDDSGREPATSGDQRAPIAREIADGGAELAAGQDSEPRSAARADETQTGDRLPLPAHVLAGGQGAVRTEHSCATHSPAAWGLAEVAGRLGVLL